MKIGILTHQYINNYGAFLQAWALREAIAELFPNDEVQIIDYVNLKHFIINAGGWFRFYKNRESFKDWMEKIKLPRTFAKARNQEMILSKRCFNAKQINALDFDCIIVGSDEVWNYKDTKGNAALKFGEGLTCKNLIAYKALMEKLKQYKPSVISMHDSWISFVCLAVNGFFYSDQNAYIMYRQHDANVLGAQRHSLKDTLMGIVKNKNVLRSDMAKEILKGYSEMMPEKTKEAFIAFAEYKENLKYKLKILMLPYNKKKTTKRTFEKVKLRVVFNTI